MDNQNTKSPLAIYLEQVSADILLRDAEQERIMQLLSNIYYQLISPKSFLEKMGLAKHQTVKGLYLWGNVGSGKTYLIDIFFHSLPFEKKLRIHFHAFMQVVHAQLHEHKGKHNPLKFVAKEFAQKATLLCLDELIVNDIADAMLLSGLFYHLYKQGVCLVFTSNITPDLLYEKGLQREQFLPAIELIKQHSLVVELSTKVDYRQQYKQHQFNYYTPCDNEALEERFFALSEGVLSDEPITVHGRPINVVKRSDNTIWFDFNTICGVPRSAKDFLTIANQYPNIFISDLCVIDSNNHNLVRSFIHLIDILYDRKILLIMSAEKPIYDIYPAGKFLFSFARTQSRITEMQAENWI